MKRQLFTSAIIIALYVCSISVAMAARTVTQDERGLIYDLPAQCAGNYACTDWFGIGAHLNQFSAQDIWDKLGSGVIKLPHGRLQHFAQLDDWTEALFPYSQFAQYDASEVAAGRPSLFATATYQGVKRPVLWNWFGAGGIYSSYPARPVNLKDERFAQFFVNQYIHPWMQKMNKANVYVLLDNGTFRYDLYGVTDNYGNFVRPVQWDLPYAQNQADFLNSINNFIVRVKQIDPSIKLVQATDAAGDTSEFWTTSQNLDGIMVENMEYYYQTPPNDWLRSQFYNQMLNVTSMANAGKIGVIGFAHTPIDTAYLRRIYMHYLMVRGDNFFFAPSGIPNGEIPPSYFSAMKSALGLPAAPTVMAQEPNLPRGYVLYSRQMTGGIAYLNWTGVTKTITLPAGRQYLSSAGVPVTQITIPDYGGDYVVFSGSTSNLAPSVSLTAPANGATYAAPATFTMTASASDADGSIARVEFWQGPNKLGEKYAAPYTWPIYNAPAGSYTGAYAFSAKAVDNLGAVTTSNAVGITVTSTTNTAPTVTLTAPVNNAVYNAPATFTMSASASDTGGSIARVEFWQGPNKLGEKYAAPYTWPLYNVPAGVYSGAYAFFAKAVDNLGAVATSNSVSITVSSSYNQPPTVALTAPVNNAIYTAPATFTMTVSASDADGSIARVEFWQGPNKLGEKYAAPYTWTIYNAPAAAYSGAYAFFAKAVDNLGAVTTSNLVSVTVK